MCWRCNFPAVKFKQKRSPKGRNIFIILCFFFLSVYIIFSLKEGALDSGKTVQDELFPLFILQKENIIHH